MSFSIDQPRDSAPERNRPLRVSELNAMLKRSVEKSVGSVWVAGEIGRVSSSGSGHVYFPLSDENTKESIAAVAFRSIAARYRNQIRQGARVLVYARATVWTGQGKLQLVVESIRPRGRGALLEALQQLKEKLAEEGLFDPERKRPVPSDAKVIGVVTSRTGAVIHDIVQVSFRRGSPRILLAPAVVQGAEAVDSLIAGLDLVERVHDLDVIIIGRGGGAFEELMPFNDERLVRRIAKCSVPVVSAVGHETDVTLTDLVADKRAATPSEAAELVVADTHHQRRTLMQSKQRLVRAIEAYIRDDRFALRELTGRLGDPRHWLDEHRQNIDELVRRAASSVRQRLRDERKQFVSLRERLVVQHPEAVIAAKRARLQQLRSSMTLTMQKQMQWRRREHAEMQAKLQTLSPLAVLDRGYALVADEQGRLILSAARVREGQRIGVRLKDGMLKSRVEKVESHE